MGKSRKSGRLLSDIIPSNESEPLVNLKTIFSPKLDTALVECIINDCDGNISQAFTVLNELLVETTGTRIPKSSLNKLTNYQSKEMSQSLQPPNSNRETKDVDQVKTIEFLMDCFPKISHARLLAVWHQSNWDIDIAIQKAAMLDEDSESDENLKEVEPPKPIQKPATSPPARTGSRTRNSKAVRLQKFHVPQATSTNIPETQVTQQSLDFPEFKVRKSGTWAERASGKVKDDPLVLQIAEIFPNISVEKIDATLMRYKDNPLRAVHALLFGDDEREVVTGFGMSNFTDSSYEDENENISKIHPNSDKVYDPEYCRRMAAQVAEKRGELFGKAATSYKRGQLTGRGAASHYAQVGHQLTIEMEEWNRRAAAAFIHRNKISFKTSNSIDLHGLTVKEAIEYVDECINQWISREPTRGSRVPLRIVVGSGAKRNEFEKGSNLFVAVSKHLKREGWRFESEMHNSVIVVKGTKN